MLTYYYLYLKNWLESREEGQDLAEYALLLLLIAIVVIAAVTLLGTRISVIFNSIATQLGGS